MDYAQGLDELQVSRAGIADLQTVSITVAVLVTLQAMDV